MKLFRIVVSETLTHAVEVEARSLGAVERAYRRAVQQTCWSDLHHTIATSVQIASISEVQR